MYSGDSRMANAAVSDAPAASTSQQGEAMPDSSGPALEVIEYADGETIWFVTLARYYPFGD